MSIEISQSAYKKLLSQISHIYDRARATVVEAYWEIGQSIVEVEQDHHIRARRGDALLEHLSEDMNAKYGTGFSVSNLKNMRRFYVRYRKRQAPVFFSWTHYQLLSTVRDKNERYRLEAYAEKENLSSRALQAILRKQRKSRQTGKSEKPLPEIRGQLYMYSLANPKKRAWKKGCVKVNCGFAILRTIPFTGHVEHDMCVSSLKKGENFRVCKKTKRTKKSDDKLYTFYATVDKIVDGDTLWLMVDCGLQTETRQKLRLRGIDTPEINTEAGKRAKRFVQKRLNPCTFVIVKTYKTEKYGRYISDIFYLPGEKDPHVVAREGTFLNQELLDHGHAVRA